jgi:hypothetical protein
MLKPDISKSIARLESDQNTLRGEISFDRNDQAVKWHRESIKRRAEHVAFAQEKTGFPSNELNLFDLKLRATIELQKRSYGEDGERAIELILETLSLWNICIPGRGKHGMESVDDAYFLPTNEGLSNTIEHGLNNNDITLITYVNQYEIATVLENKVPASSIPNIRILEEKLQTQADALESLHTDIDQAEPEQKRDLIHNLRNRSNAAFRSLIPDIQQSFIDNPNFGFIYRGNGTSQLAKSRMNYAWLSLEGDTFRRSLMLSKARYDEIQT